MLEQIKGIAIREFDLQPHDVIVITGGFPLGKTRTTNNIRIVEV